jgi:hypothetical protein
MAREHGLAQRRHGAGDAVEELEDRRERVLDRAESALDGRLLGRRALALRRVLDAERLVRLLGRLGDVRRALVGDELQALAAGGSLGDDAHDHLGVFALGDLERVEQVALAIAEILDADQLRSTPSTASAVVSPPSWAP